MHPSSSLQHPTIQDLFRLAQDSCPLFRPLRRAFLVVSPREWLAIAQRSEIPEAAAQAGITKREFAIQVYNEHSFEEDESRCLQVRIWDKAQKMSVVAVSQDHAIGTCL